LVYRVIFCGKVDASFIIEIATASTSTFFLVKGFHLRKLTDMSTPIITVDKEMVDSLRKAIKDCADRGLQNASKWYAGPNCY